MTNCPNRIGPIDPNSYESCIGKQVYKLSKKPFKSQLKVNTVTGVKTNPNNNRLGFTFVEDDSIVDCHICNLI